MQGLDLLVLGVYLAVVVAVGVRFSGRQRTLRDYFLTDRNVPWWALLASIVATETSTVTLISVPGYAFGGDLTFLQLALGYILGKIFVATVLIPRFFRGDLLTAYQPLSQRFGPPLGRLAALIFLGTRSLSDGFRLFATGLVLAAALATLPTIGALGTDLLPLAIDRDTSLVIVSVGLISLTTLAYTLLGGMRAVIWTDVVQLVVYMAGALVAGLMVLSEIPGGWREVVTVAAPADKLVLVDLTADLTRSYTFWSGLIGGMFLTAGTHGTDQMFVQRYLCSRTPRDASRALVWSGVFVFVQFAVFLALGVMLWVYYTVYAPDGLAAITIGGVVQTDRILPTFMVSHLPLGLRGLVVAAIVAAAMSTLSSSLNSSAASTVGDFYIPWRGDARPASHDLSVSRWVTVGWALVQAAVAVVAIRLSSRVVDEVLGIQSFTLGLLLGVFLLAMTTTRHPAAPLAGLAGGTSALVALRLLTAISWQWYVLAGAFTTCTVGWITGRFLDRQTRQPEGPRAP